MTMDKEHRFFEHYAPTWDQDRHENKEKIQFLLSFVPLPKDGRVLDVGCGTGVLIPYLHQAVGDGGQVEGLDYSQAMLTQAKRKFERLPGVTFREENILKYGLLPHAYDTIVCLNFYPHIREQSAAFIKAMYSALKDGGTLAIMHDISRDQVNAIHQQSGQSVPLLPPVDVLATMLLSAGFVVTAALDRADYYLIVVKKQENLSYDEPVATDVGTESHLERHLHSHDGVHHHHHHSHTQTKVVMNRLARISGHLEAIKRMIDDGRDCSDVLVQLSAVDSAIISVSKVILKDHIDHCIVDAIKENDLDAVENLKKAISTFVK